VYEADTLELNATFEQFQRAVPEIHIVISPALHSRVDLARLWRIETSHDEITYSRVRNPTLIALDSWAVSPSGIADEE
jgi:hypothetical protein